MPNLLMFAVNKVWEGGQGVSGTSYKGLANCLQDTGPSFRLLLLSDLHPCSQPRTLVPCSCLACLGP